MEKRRKKTRKASGNSPSSIHYNILHVSGRRWHVNTPREALGGSRTVNYWVLVPGSPSSAAAASLPASPSASQLAPHCVHSGPTSNPPPTLPSPCFFPPLRINKNHRRNYHQRRDVSARSSECDKWCASVCTWKARIQTGPMNVYNLFIWHKWTLSWRTFE